MKNNQQNAENSAMMLCKVVFTLTKLMKIRKNIRLIIPVFTFII